MIGKPWLLLLSVMIVAAVAVLASSLHDVRFEPGRALSSEAPSAAPPALPEAETISQVPLWKLLLFWLAFVLNLILFFLLVPPEMRKRLLRQMISLALGTLAVLFALRYRLIQLPSLNTEPVTKTNPGSNAGAGNAPMPVFQPPSATSWWTYVISFAVLAVVLLALWYVYRWWMRPGARYLRELDEIGAIAQSSLDEIAAGREWSDVIIQSYARMSEAVSARRGLQRARATTPREFAERLEQAGLPAQAVVRLTRLFESARYGARAASRSDMNEAVACLNSILQACGQTQ
jgi:uncharacterized protein DUF4129